MGGARRGSGGRAGALSDRAHARQRARRSRDRRVHQAPPGRPARASGAARRPRRASTSERFRLLVTGAWRTPASGSTPSSRPAQRPRVAPWPAAAVLLRALPAGGRLRAGRARARVPVQAPRSTSTSRSHHASFAGPSAASSTPLLAPSCARPSLTSSQLAGPRRGPGQRRRPASSSLIDRLLKPSGAGFPGALGLRRRRRGVPASRPDGELVVAKDAIVEHVSTSLPGRPAVSRSPASSCGSTSPTSPPWGGAPGLLDRAARPPRPEDDWLARLLPAGLAEDEARFGLPPSRRRHGLDAGSAGSVPHHPGHRAHGTGPPTQSGARSGTTIWVSGTLGGAAMGLRVLRGLALPDEAGARTWSTATAHHARG